MGTIIDLTVGGVSVDWSKNFRGNDHGVLFQGQDRQRLHSEQADDVDDDDELDQVSRMVFTRPLRALVPRLELLGYRIETVRHIYEQMAKNWKDDQIDYDNEAQEVLEPLTFEEMLDFVRSYPIQQLDGRFVEEFDERGKRKIQGRFAGLETVAHIPVNPDHASNAYSERSYFGVLIDFLDPYAALRLLAENPANLDQNVVWEYGPLVNAGWADASEFVPCARREQTILIATEGSSDVHILKRAIEVLRPEVADFFRFIDVSERHPFSGTGSLVKFAEGLAKIDVQNQVLVLLDNDAEGVDAYEAIQRFRLPKNMRALVLPELDEFRQFRTRGPEGLSKSDINGRAAAIECYLDLAFPNQDPATVIWTNYKKERGVYQGSLEYKETYARAFLEQTAESIRKGDYDVRKLERVLDSLIEESSLIAASVVPIN